MLEFQEKRKLKRLIYSRVTLVVFIIIFAFLLKAVWDVYKKQAITRDNLAKTAAVYEGLRAREEMLSSEIERLKTESGTEEEIREKYGLVKPGEEVLVIVDGDEVVGSTPVSSGSNFWQKIVNWFK